MTQEEKAKAYDEALEKAKLILDMTSDKSAIYTIFPELKESEDERMRIWIINYLDNKKLNSSIIVEKENLKKAIAWLEKQGEQKSIDVSIKEKAHQIAWETSKHYDPLLSKECWCEMAALDMASWLKKHGEQKVSVVDFKAKDWYVSKVDGKIYNAKFMETTNQARKLEIEKAAMSATGIIEQEEWFIKGAEWSDKNPSYISSEKQVEQKPINKVEPKFKVGDWVVQGRNILKIRCVGDEYYCFETVGGYVDDMLVSEIDSLYHLWTIQDAKDGDVLCCESGWTCIFKALDNYTNTFSSYCFMDSYKWFCSAGSVLLTLQEEFVKAYNGKINPATKVQRDTLIKAMADAGYTFDFEKKELRKINSYCEKHCKGYQETGKCFADSDCKAKREAEQNPAWSEEDKKMFEYALDMIEWYSGKNEDKSRLVSNWLKSLKDRVQPKQESDERNRLLGKLEKWLDEYVSNLADVDTATLICSFTNYLDGKLPKTLRPQNRCKTSDKLDEASYQVGIKRVLENPESYGLTKYNWKPSDEQMKLLREVQQALLGKDCHNRFVNFMYELKKLREE